MTALTKVLQVCRFQFISILFHRIGPYLPKLLYLSVYLSVYQSLFLSTYLSTCLSVCMSVCLAFSLRPTGFTIEKKEKSLELQSCAWIVNNSFTLASWQLSWRGINRTSKLKKSYSIEDFNPAPNLMTDHGGTSPIITIDLNDMADLWHTRRRPQGNSWSHPDTAATCLEQVWPPWPRSVSYRSRGRPVGPGRPWSIP